MFVSSGFVDITPSHSLPLFGYAGRRQPFTGIDSRIEVNALRIVDGAREIFLVSIDCLFAGNLAGDLQARLRQVGLDTTVVCVASHTHFAPCLDATKPQLGSLDQGYYQFVLSRCEDLLGRLRNGSQSAATLVRAAARTGARLAINRRDIRWKIRPRWPFVSREAVLAPNFASEREFPMTVLRVQGDSDKAGRPQAILWHWTCHPVAAADANRLSSNFPGAVRARLRERYGEDLPVLFLQGFCGDVRPAVGIRKPSLREALSGFPGPVFAPIGEEAYRDWLGAVADEVMRIVAAGGELLAPGGNGLGFASIDIPVGDLMNGNTSNAQFSLGLLRLGGDLSLLLASAEILSGFEDMVFAAFGTSCLPVGYWNDNFGYLPTDADIVHRGYEVDGFRPAFSLDGRYTGGVDPIVEAGLRELRS